MIAQSWETLDGLSLHNHEKPQMACDCTIHLLHIVIEIKVPAPLFTFQAKLGEILHRIIEGILPAAPRYAPAAPRFAPAAPHFAHAAPRFAHAAPEICSF